MIPFLLMVAFADTVLQVSAQSQPSCDSKVYCQGKLLHVVEMSRIFNDSKTFVELKMINDEQTTLENFDNFLRDTNHKRTRADLMKFVSDNFKQENEFESWTPTDFTDNPTLLSRIEDKTIRQFAQDLVKIWPTLARKVKKEVLDYPEHYSLLPVDNGFIIPGGRFTEFLLLGLLLDSGGAPVE
jgi:alpha,alpha-trehalase